MSNFEKIIGQFEELKENYGKYEKGNKSAGTRARKNLQEIKKVAQEIRVEIVNSRNGN